MPPTRDRVSLARHGFVRLCTARCSQMCALFSSAPPQVTRLAPPLPTTPSQPARHFRYDDTQAHQRLVRFVSSLSVVRPPPPHAPRHRWRQRRSPSCAMHEPHQRARPRPDFAQRALATLLTRPWLAVGDDVFLERRPRSARALRSRAVRHTRRLSGEPHTARGRSSEPHTQRGRGVLVRGASPRCFCAPRSARALEGRAAWCSLVELCHASTRSLHRVRAGRVAYALPDRAEVVRGRHVRGRE